MFNNNLKKEALKIHEKTLADYNASYGIMGKSCELLYEIRGKSVGLIKLVQEVVNCFCGRAGNHSNSGAGSSYRQYSRRVCL